MSDSQPSLTQIELDKIIEFINRFPDEQAEAGLEEYLADMPEEKFEAFFQLLLNAHEATHGALVPKGTPAEPLS